MPIPVWLVFALLSVAGKTAFYVLQKRLLEDESSLRTGYISAVYGFFLLLPLVGVQATTTGVQASRFEIGIIAGLGLIELIGFAVYLKALDLTDLSIASPIKKSKPVGVALLEPIVLGAVFAPALAAAAILAGVGGYIILMDETSLIAPFKRITEPGPLLAFLSAGIYVILSLGSRFGTTATSPYVYGVIVYGVMMVGYTGVLWHQGQLPSLRKHVSRDYIALGFLAFFRSITVWIAYSLATATTVSTVTQMTILLDVLAGGALLQEGHTKRRVIGAGLILIGVLLVILKPTF